ncbi:MAG TPA: type II toxin-antitoxin system prevent-host-death family antitoxin [Candidatus Paceibacterota bacterium]|nr:type II toxin-antitoxin system prevent-host-death family antitoxin [Candidatus Paceibacterota bacterium]
MFELCFIMAVVDGVKSTHYIGHMIVSLRESKTHLSHLVSLAESGQEILITVRGKPRARLTAIPRVAKLDMAGWKTRLERLRKRYSTGKVSLKSEIIISDLREER